MIYTGEFKNINNELYRINIEINNGVDDTEEIIFSPEAFIIEYNDGDTIYEPLKLSNATCTLVSDKYLFDLYVGTAQGAKITLLKINDINDKIIEWVGYVTPNIYNMGWEKPFEEIQLEAIDGLSTLENYKYEIIDNQSANIITKNQYSATNLNDPFMKDYFTYYTSLYPVESDITISSNSLLNGSFTSIIPKGATTSNIHTYTTTSLLTPSYSITNITPKNDYKYFYTNDSGLNFNNKKIKSFEDIIIHCIKKTNCYSKIYINQNSQLSDKTKLIDKLFVAEQNFFDDGGEAETYKEVLLQIIQYLGYTITAKGDAVYILDYDYIKNGYTDYLLYTTTNNWNSYTLSNATLQQNYNITGESFKASGTQIELDNVYNQVAIKTSLYNKESLIIDIFNDDYLTNIINTYQHWNDNYQVVDGDKVYSTKYYKHKYYDYLNYDTGEVIEYTEIHSNDLNYGTKAFITRQGMYDQGTTPASISYSDYIQLMCHFDANSTHISKPILRLKSGIFPENSYLFDSYYDVYYIVISCSALWTDQRWEYYVSESGVSKDDKNFDDSMLYIIAKLQIGNKYWDGTAWTTSNSTFKINFSKGSNTNFNYKWFEIKNTVNYNDYIDGTGQKIPMHFSDELIGEVNFSIYSPEMTYPAYRLDNVFLKDFDIKLLKQNSTKSKTTDTEYKNIINTDFVNEFSDLEFKVCTYTGKGMNYSSVIELNSSNKLSYNKALYNKSLNKTQIQECNIIEKYVNQYTTPKKKFILTLGNDFTPYTLFTISDIFTNEKFIVNKMSIDIFNDNNTLTIVEKN